MTGSGRFPDTIVRGPSDGSRRHFGIPVTESGPIRSGHARWPDAELSSRRLVPPNASDPVTSVTIPKRESRRVGVRPVGRDRAGVGCW